MTSLLLCAAGNRSKLKCLKNDKSSIKRQKPPGREVIAMKRLSLNEWLSADQSLWKSSTLTVDP